MHSNRGDDYSFAYTLEDLFYQLIRFIEESVIVVIVSMGALIASLVYLYTNTTHWQRICTSTPETDYESVNTVLSNRSSMKTLVSDEKINTENEEEENKVIVVKDSTKEFDRDIKKISVVNIPKVPSCDERFVKETGYTACSKTIILQATNNDLTSKQSKSFKSASSKEAMLS